MKIDLVITELEVGGAEQCLTHLAVHLHRQSHSVRVIALGPAPAPDRDRLWKRLQEAAIETHFLGGRRFWHLPWILWRLSSLIRRSPPEFAQSFLFHANVIAAWTYPGRKIPLIGGVRVVDPSRWRWWISRVASWRMQRVVCVSQAVAEHCLVHEGVPPEKIAIITNGIHIDGPVGAVDEAYPATLPIENRSCYAQRRLGIAPTTPCLLFVGRIDRQKGIDILVDRLDELLTALPLHHVIILGDGPLKIEMQTKASRCEHEARVHFIGRRDDVLEWMKSSQLLLLPTRFEGMPNVVLEAMACGLPVVSTRAEGVLELLGEFAADQTVSVGDWPGWTAKVIALAQDRRLHRCLSEANRERCLRHFNLTDKLDEYVKLYASLQADDVMRTPPPVLRPREGQ